MTNKLQIIDMLKKYAEVYKHEEIGKYFGYSRAIAMVNEQIADDATPEEIKAAIESGIYGIGASIGSKITALLDNETPSHYDEIVEKYIKYNLDKKEVNPHKHYMLRDRATHLIDWLLHRMNNCDISYEICGSYRRKSEIVGDLDILVVNQDLDLVNAIIDNLNDGTTDIKVTWLARGLSKSKIEWSSSNGTIEIDFRSIKSAEFGSMALHFTGPRDFNIRLRRVALSQGWSLNEYGLHKLDGSYSFTADNEEAIFKKLGLAYVHPWDRR